MLYTSPQSPSRYDKYNKQQGMLSTEPTSRLKNWDLFLYSLSVDNNGNARSVTYIVFPTVPKFMHIANLLVTVENPSPNVYIAYCRGFTWSDDTQNKAVNTAIRIASDTRGYKRTAKTLQVASIDTSIRLLRMHPGPLYSFQPPGDV